jgi:hypothetical protein
VSVWLREAGDMLGQLVRQDYGAATCANVVAQFKNYFRH